MRIAVFDYRVIPTNPVGGCHLRLLSGLCRRHEFTVFAVDFENPCPERIRWVRIPLPVRPYILLFTLYHLTAPLAYAWQRWFRGARFDLVQMVESNLLFGDLSYSHFCHRMYLKRHWRETRIRGVRGLLRGLAHRAASLLEPWVYHRVNQVVVPSHGLCTELSREYPAESRKISLVSNPVDVERLQPPPSGERETVRAAIGYSQEDRVLVFAALGHFERKGLPLVLEAMRRISDSRLRLLVVGGERGLVDAYRARARDLGIQARVRFEGMQRDLRRYYWAADAFILPSSYEVFPLVVLEAAAAGLPLIVTPLNGVEEMLRDGWNGILVEHTAQGVENGIRKWLALAEDQRARMGRQARQAAMQYSSENFVAAWKTFYERWSLRVA
jgi:glycosyltransferase involved in cell wall biosynthesis